MRPASVVTRIVPRLRAAPLVVAAGLVACTHPGSPSRSEAAANGGAAPARAAADPAAEFAMVQRVLQHPRCLNCHPAGDRPLQGDDSHVHLQNIQRGEDGRGPKGLSCNACHGAANPPASYGFHAPPGVASGWHLPPRNMRMVFEGRSTHDLCEQLKDPARTGGKDMPAMLAHLSTDLVLWGWAPGYGRAPVPIPHDRFVAAWASWAAAGAPCPP
ncbi:MAG: hypothetical protein NVSMB23_21020 [Myxococcales bacterium]